MKAIIRAARGGLGGRRLQAVVIGLVVLACTAASVLAVGMLVDSQSPFDRGFAAQHGADVAADMSPSAASPAQLAATSHVSGVTAVAGPFPETTVGGRFTIPGVSGSGSIQVHLVGRSSPNGPVDSLTLKSGHWPTAPDQVVWSQAGPVSGGLQLGSTVTFPGAPGSPTLTVVGFANSITNTADAWVLPAEIAALSGAGSQRQAQMLYRFSSASTATAVNADVSALKAALPAGTFQGTASYLDVRTAEQSNVAIWAPFIIAFGIIALAMSVLIVAQPGQGKKVIGAGGPPSASPAEQRAIAAALTANPDIAHWVPETGATVGVAGMSQQPQVTAFDGGASWTGYPMIKGSWYSGSGSVDVNTTFLTDTGTSVGSTVTLTSGGRSETVRIAGEAFANDSSDPAVFMSGSDLARIDPGQAPTQYYAGVKPGADPQAVANALTATLDPSGPAAAAVAGIQVTPNDNGELIAVVTLIALLTILLVVVAGLGVLNTVVLQLRERVHDLGVFKSVGMTPRQAIAMVVCSVTLIGLLAGIVGVPLGVLVHNGVVPVMGHAANTDLPAAVIAVYSWWQYVLLALAGLVIAVVAALGPAGWAARTRTAFALRAE